MLNNHFAKSMNLAMMFFMNDEVIKTNNQANISNIMTELV